MAHKQICKTVLLLSAFAAVTIGSLAVVDAAPQAAAAAGGGAAAAGGGGFPGLGAFLPPGLALPGGFGPIGGLVGGALNAATIPFNTLAAGLGQLGVPAIAVPFSAIGNALQSASTTATVEG